MSFARLCLLLVLAPALSACGVELHLQAGGRGSSPRVLVAHLAGEGGDAAGFEALGAAFANANPGYDLVYHVGARELKAKPEPRVMLVQKGHASASIGASSSELGVGDLVLLRGGQAWSASEPLDLLCFECPASFPGELPSWIRPDWDPKITDTPGGCATETGAYRRILLTWLQEKGPYVYHALNVHRVRIQDSFTHYHPLDGGFDEFYLVQQALPDSRLLTSERTAEILAPQTLERESARSLLETHSLAVGDLVYLPRGSVHRGLGGALVQVITVPGFRPGAEIGVDAELIAINARLSLEGEEALPFHAEATPVATPSALSK